MGCSEGPLWVEMGLGCGPFRILWLWFMGFERMRVRSSSKGQAEARSPTHRAKSDILLRPVIWVRVFPAAGRFNLEFYTERMSRTS